jgi:hypothetical protein
MTQKRYRLLARAQLDGEVRQPGYVFTLAQGERGPHRTVVASNAGGMAWRASTLPDGGWAMPDEFMPATRDEPLFEEVKDNG